MNPFFFSSSNYGHILAQEVGIIPLDAGFPQGTPLRGGSLARALNELIQMQV